MPSYNLATLFGADANPDPDSDIDGKEPLRSVKFDFKPYTRTILGHSDPVQLVSPAVIQFPVIRK